MYGVRFTDEEDEVIKRVARAKDAKPGTYIRQAAMETARLHDRALGQ